MYRRHSLSGGLPTRHSHRRTKCDVMAGGRGGRLSRERSYSETTCTVGIPYSGEIFVGLIFRYQALKAYFRGLIFVT